MGRVDGKVAIVTGGGRGIGRECARLLAREGARVYLTDRDHQPGREAEAAIREQGGAATFVPHDVSVEDDWARLVELVVEQAGAIDVLVNNAGLYVIEPLEQSTVECLRRIFETNVQGVFLGMKHVAPAMAAYGAAKEGRTLDELGEDFPLGTIGEPIDVAWGVLYLASDESRWVTGIQLPIDGGILAS